MDKFAALWDVIKKANPAQRLKIVEQLDEKSIEELKKVANPYRKPVYNSSANYANISVYNTNRLYERQLQTTAIIGFLYKVATEFKHPTAEKFPSELDGELGKEIAKLKRKCSIAKPENFYAQIAEKTKKPVDYAIWQRAKARMTELLSEDFQKEYDKAKEKAQYDKSTEAQMAFKMAQEKVDGFKKTIADCETNIKSVQSEHGVRNEEIVVHEVSLDDQDVLEITDMAKKKLGIEKTKEEHESYVQDYILDFLDYFFRFDPNNHIRAGYQPNYDKVVREKIKNNTEKFKYANDGKMIITDKFAEYLVPPADTFASMKHYFESNYEYLRQCTDDIYGETNIIESCVMVYDVFSSEEKANAWKEKYKKDVNADIYTVKTMNWVLIDNFAENRAKIRGSDAKMRLLDRVVEKMKEDEKIGQDLLKKRGKKMPNRAGGSGPPGKSKELEELGIDKMEDLADGTHPTDKELEVKVFSTKLVKIGRRFKQIQKDFRFNIEAEAPKETIPVTSVTYDKWKESK